MDVSNLSSLEEEFKEGKSKDFIYATINNGISTNIKYYESLAALASYKIEESIASNQNEVVIRNTMAKSVSDVNLRIDDVAMRYINNENKLIDIRGPLFSTIEMRVL